MIIDFQAHVFPEAYLAEMKRLDGAVILEEPDPHSGMQYFYDKKLKCRINTATLQGQNIEKRLKHMDVLPTLKHYCWKQPLIILRLKGCMKKMGGNWSKIPSMNLYCNDK